MKSRGAAHACRRQESPTLTSPPPPRMQLRGGVEEATGINLFSIPLPQYYRTHLGGEGRGRMDGFGSEEHRAGQTQQIPCVTMSQSC